MQYSPPPSSRSSPVPELSGFVSAASAIASGAAVQGAAPGDADYVPHIPTAPHPNAGAGWASRCSATPLASTSPPLPPLPLPPSRPGSDAAEGSFGTAGPSIPTVASGSTGGPSASYVSPGGSRGGPSSRPADPETARQRRQIGAQPTAAYAEESGQSFPRRQPYAEEAPRQPSLASRLRRKVETHSEQLAGLRRELDALRDCLEDFGFVSREHFLRRLHARSFAAVLQAHPCHFDASINDVLQGPGQLHSLTLAAGLSGTRALRACSRSISQTVAAVVASVEPDLRNPMYGASCAVCVGGFNGAQCLSFVELFDPTVGTWQALQPMTERRAGAAAAVLGGMAFVCGGSNDLQCLSSVERLDIPTGQWETMPEMSDRRDGAASVAAGNHVYIFGGYNGVRFLNSVERFDPARRTWEFLPQMSERRYRGAATVLGGKIYVIGGSDDRRCLSHAQRFDPMVGTWELLPPMQVRRDGAALVSFRGSLYVLGGHDGFEYLRSAERFDPLQGVWTMLPNMTERRYRSSAANVAGRVYVFGGFDGRIYLNSVERFDHKAGIWEPGPPMRVRRAWTAAGAVHRWGASGVRAERWGRLGLANHGLDGMAWS